MDTFEINSIYHHHLQILINVCWTKEILNSLICFWFYNSVNLEYIITCCYGFLNNLPLWHFHIFHYENHILSFVFQILFVQNLWNGTLVQNLHLKLAYLQFLGWINCHGLLNIGRPNFLIWLLPKLLQVEFVFCPQTQLELGWMLNEERKDWLQNCLMDFPRLRKLRVNEY